MKQFVTIIFIFTSSFAYSQESKFLELNLGAGVIDIYGELLPAPGLSLVYGKIYENKRSIYNSQDYIFEWQIGLALPSVVTGKLTFGLGDSDKYWGLSIRPWPLFIGPQVKLNNWSFSFEYSPSTEIEDIGASRRITSFDVPWILNLGWRKQL
tara:strand:- start:59 stop:517 length:459 start_codon:yes stop_codon:yes gene_type:complete